MDAGDYQGDAATGDPADDDHIHDEPDAADAAATPDAASTAPSTGTPADGVESAGDAPGETNSLPDVPVSKRKQSSTTATDEPTANAGCSASPRSPMSSFGGTLGLALGVAALLRRKRR